MNITISFDIDGYTENDELVAWLNAALAGRPVKVRRTWKPRKPMTEEEEATFRARMVKGQEEAAKARNEEDARSSDSAAVKTKANTAKPAGRARTASSAYTKKS